MNLEERLKAKFRDPEYAKKNAERFAALYANQDSESFYIGRSVKTSFLGDVEDGKEIDRLSFIRSKTYKDFIASKKERNKRN